MFKRHYLTSKCMNQYFWTIMHHKTGTSDATGSTLLVSNFLLSYTSSRIVLALELHVVCVLCGEQEKMLTTQEIVK